MNYIAITACEIANGLGCRVALWVAGCPHHCNGCHNSHTWDYNAGKEFGAEALDKLAAQLHNPHCDGLTITGGEPLCSNNIWEVTNLARKIKESFPNQTLWVFTGYLFEDVKDLEIMKYIDVLVDGPFVLSQRDITLAFRGSANQRLINVQDSIKTGTVQIYKMET